MNVAYDLRYADGHFTGVGTHAYLLLRALLELDGDERYTVLWSRPRKDRYDVRALADHPRVRWVERDLPTMTPMEPLRLGSWLRALRPDVYLSPFYWLPLGAPCPCLLTIHDLWPLRLHGDLDPVKRAILRHILGVAARARMIVTSSDFSRREIMELMGVPGERVRVTRLGVAPRAAVEPSRPSALAEGPFALVVGDNRPRKNLRLLAQVWAGMGRRPPLGLVGVGPANRAFPSLGELAASLGAEAVSGLGWVSEAELAWLYANATMVLYPTVYEGFGLPLTEAFDRGVPAVASDIPVLREIGEGAVRFVPPSEPDRWREAILGLADSPAERARLKRAGLERARELTYERTAGQVLELLREVTAGGGRA
jgi:glycosyltransferase involved in cell wall biosynthesis